MKNTLLLILLVACLPGCKSFDPQFLNPSGEAFNPKLPAMESYVENNLVAIISPTGQTIGASPQDIITLFDREVAEIITNPYEVKKGYLVLKVNTIETRSNIWLAVVSGALFSIPNLFGLPLNDAIAVVEVQIEVLDNNKKLLGSYRAGSKKRLKSGFYSKTNYRELPRVAYFLAVKEAIQLAKAKMVPDLNRLVQELNKQK